MKSRELKVNCPTCNEIVVWSEANPFRPFCTERCKLIDFGDWAAERHVIAGESVPTQDDEDEGY
ncbi:MAG: DNA gyrase inhibitor YacG [Gammaproteobacteria bacterium]